MRYTGDHLGTVEQGGRGGDWQGAEGVQGVRWRVPARGAWSSVCASTLGG